MTLWYAICSAEGKPILEDGVSEVAKSLLAAYDSGELSGALAEGQLGWKSWVKNFGKMLKRKVRSDYFLFPLNFFLVFNEVALYTRENLCSCPYGCC